MASPSPALPSPLLFSLAGRNVLITGASRGIGQACAVALAQAGARICLVVRNAAAAADTLAAIPAAEHVLCDLADIDAVRRVFEVALDKMGGEIHVLVNCAGIQRRAPSVEFLEQDWDDEIGRAHV